MALSAESEALLAPLRQSVKEQGDLVRQLKADKATEIEVKKAPNKLAVEVATEAPEDLLQPGCFVVSISGSKRRLHEVGRCWRHR